MSTSEPSEDRDKSPQGRAVQPQDRQTLTAAILQVLDYRGDVTLSLSDGRTIEGYVFDARLDANPPIVRLLKQGVDQPMTVELNQIIRIAFTGRDTAEGKSWQTWVENYQRRKALGQSANLDPEPLD